MSIELKRPQRGPTVDGAPTRTDREPPMRRAVAPDKAEAAKGDGPVTFTVRTPSLYSGYTLGVHFHDGEGITRNAIIARQLRDDFGYEVEPDAGPQEALPPLPHERRRRETEEERYAFGPRDPRLPPGADPAFADQPTGKLPRSFTGEAERKDQGDGQES